MSVFSAAHVQRCRDAWNTPQLAELFVAFCQSCVLTDISTRLRLEEIGGVQLALDIIREDRDAPLVARAWLILQNFVLVHSVDNPEEMKPIDIFVERGGVELAAVELNRAEPRWSQTILTTLAWTSTNERAVPRVIASGVHKIGINFVRDANQLFLDISMSFIRSASAARSCRSTLRADGALEAFIPFVACNKSTEELEMRRGFRAASVVARLAGNDETGIGPTILRNNPDLIQTTLNIFQRVLSAGPDGTVINMLVNPHFITMDLLIISTADVNKPLLIRAIPICMSALKLRGETNPPMVADIVKLFLQLSFEPSCKTELLKVGLELFDLLGKLVPSPQQLRALKLTPMTAATPAMTFFEHDSETATAAQMLRTSLSSAPPPLPASLGASPGAFVQGIVRRMVQSNRAQSMDSANTQSSSEEALRPCVVISYSWHSSDLARKLDESLRQQGIRVWIDFRNMDASPGDSMEQAMRDAGILVVLASSRFKESAVCRKEVELAEEKRVPIIFFQAEEGYKPNGWLGRSLAVANSMVPNNQPQMLPGWTSALIKSSVSAFIKRLCVLAPACLAPPPPSPPPQRVAYGMKEPSSVQPSIDQADPRLLEAIATLTMSVNEMRKELNELRMEVRGMKSN